MLPSALTLSALRFILSAKSGQSYKQAYATVDFCNSRIRQVPDRAGSAEDLSDSLLGLSSSPYVSSLLLRQRGL
ncbi:hypothetical protein [uncultured Porphyromonas sp.]|uniref:hypothetical protein n=1 Tax=uncultured Porphyromonas sp. TaxID=159274 RepID=UPI002638577F|nr:hypothetical protein [uncultured Porphyromonas sp.]